MAFLWKINYLKIINYIKLILWNGKLFWLDRSNIEVYGEVSMVSYVTIHDKKCCS